MRKSLIAGLLTVATAAAVAALGGVALAADGGNDTNGDLRCAVPLPEGEGIGGHVLGGGPPKGCNAAPVGQFQSPQKLL